MAYDQFGRVIRSAPAPQIPSSQNSFSYQSSPSYSNFGSYRESVWTRMDNAVRSFGNWFDDIIPTISNWGIGIVALIGLIGLIAFVFKDWNIFYMIFRFIGACIMGYIGAIIIGIGAFIVGLGLKILRFCLWNIYTLLLALALAGGFGIYVYANNTSTSSATSAYEQPIKLTDSYEITAYELNVRTAPSKNASIAGRLHKGDQIEVYEISNGFASIDYNGSRCYVSEKYIRRRQTTNEE